MSLRRVWITIGVVLVVAGAVAAVSLLTRSRAEAVPDLATVTGRKDAPIIDGQRALVLEPKRPNGRAVIYLHGAGGSERSPVTVAPFAAIAHELLRSGYVVASSNAHGDDWGSARSVRDYERLVRAVRADGANDIYVLAASMGGLPGIEIIDRASITAWAGISPVCNARSMADGPHRDSVRSAHPAGTPAGLGTARRVRGLPMAFWASPDDEIVSKSANTDRCASDLRSRGARVQVTETSGNHQASFSVPPAEVVRFFASNR